MHRLALSVLFALTLVLARASSTRAQTFSADLGIGLGPSAQEEAVSGQFRFSVPLGIELGGGLRLSRFFGSEETFRNVGAGDPAVFDDLELAPNVWALNLMVVGEIGLFGPLSGGFDLDLLGLAFGPSRTLALGRAEPASFSAFLVGERDRGSLNSEFYLALALVPRVKLRAGASHFVTGYEVTRGGTSSRYQRFYTVPFVGVRLEL